MGHLDHNLRRDGRADDELGAVRVEDSRRCMGGDISTECRVRVSYPLPGTFCWIAFADCYFRADLSLAW